MGTGKKGKIASCYQCAGIEFCFGTKRPELKREEGRAKAAACCSLHKGLTTETVTVIGYERGCSRANAEKLVLNGLARWCSYKTIETVSELPFGMKKRLMKEEKDRRKACNKINC